MGINCLNYMNQEAIDQAIEEHNLKLREKLYLKGTNVCGHCLGHPFLGSGYRICYQPRLIVRPYWNSYAVYDNLTRGFVCSVSGEIHTRDTPHKAKKLMAGIERSLPVPE